MNWFFLKVTGFFGSKLHYSITPTLMAPVFGEAPHEVGLSH